MNLCKDCKHCIVTEKPEYSRCLHPLVSPNGSKGISLVTGAALMEGKAYYCSTERGGLAGYAYPCGAEGKLFEPISAPDRKLPATDDTSRLGSETARD